MGNEAKTTPTTASGSNVGGGGFRARMEHYIYSGEKKHVMAGIAIIAVVFGAPWFLMNRGCYRRKQSMLPVTSPALLHSLQSCQNFSFSCGGFSKLLKLVSGLMDSEVEETGTPSFDPNPMKD
ncbi:hypothetical protein POUND7_003765 [Theobroma cacao]